MARRNTEQRRAIRTVFEQADRPLSTDEVYRATQQLKPRIGIATVYRTLKILTQDGWLKTVQLPGMPPRYERSERPAHHHFYCSACRRAFEVPCCQALLDTVVPEGFRVETHALLLQGACKECLDAGGKALGSAAG